MLPIFWLNFAFDFVVPKFESRTKMKTRFIPFCSKSNSNCSIIQVLFMKSQKSNQSKANKRGRTRIIQTTTESQPQFDPGLFSKFKRFINEQRLRELKMRLHEYYGKNFPINYKNNYNFYEQWQNQRQNLYQKSDQEVINKTIVGSLLSVFIMTIFSASIWTCTVNQFFSQANQVFIFSFQVYLITLLAHIIDACIKLWHYLPKQKEMKDIKMIDLIRICYQNIVCIIYLSFLISNITSQYDPLWIILEVASQIMMYWRAKKIYESFHYVDFALKYEYQFKAFDLILNLLIFAHFMSIILFSTTKISSDVNWFTALNLHNPTDTTKYVYSFYFCTTTILTVGYGDITPKNPTEIVIVTFLQIFGIIIFGYLVNEIGYNLSALRKRSQMVKRELNLMEKMRRYYRMDNELIHKAKTYLINRELESDQLSPQEENGLLAKFNEDLRNEISSSATLSIVKSSIFFLCRWSKSMQNSVARRLVHALFSPGEQLYQPQSKERIYLLRLGKIDIYTERRGNRLGNKSVLKSLESDLNREVSDNCYGYTAAISARPVRLYAICKDYASAFYIQKQKFQECINGKSTDFEYFHEIKNRIDQSQLWESLEVPSLCNSKHHYNPTRLHVIRKSRKQAKTKNERSMYFRQHRKLFRGGNIIHDPEQSKDIHRVFIPSLQDSNFDQITKKTQNNSHIFQKVNSREMLENFGETVDIKKLFHHYFESAKQYTNYFVNQNIQQILKRYQNEYLRFENHNRNDFIVSIITHGSSRKEKALLFR